MVRWNGELNIIGPGKIYKKIKYYENANSKSEQSCRKNFEVVYDANENWTTKTYYNDDEAQKEYFKLVNKKDDIYEFKFSNGENEAKFEVYESKDKSEAPTVRLKGKYDNKDKETFLYEIISSDGKVIKSYSVDDIEAYKNKKECNMTITYYSSLGDETSYKATEQYCYKLHRTNDKQSNFDLDLYTAKYNRYDTNNGFAWGSVITYNTVNKEEGYITYYNHDGSKKLTMTLEQANKSFPFADDKKNDKTNLEETAKDYKDKVEKASETTKEENKKANEIANKSNEIINYYNENIKNENYSDTSSGSNGTTSGIDLSDISKGDILKFKGYAWYLRDLSTKETLNKFINEGNTLEVLEVENNYLKIKMLSGEYENQEFYIKYGSDGNKYFEKVSAVSAGDSNSDSKFSQTTDDEKSDSLLKIFFKKIYLNYFKKTEEETNKLLESEMITTYINDIKSGKLTICDVIAKIFTEDVIYDSKISDEEFVKRVYGAFTYKNPTADEIKAYTSRIGSNTDNKMSRSEVIESVLLSEDFKNVCKELMIDEKNIGKYTVVKANDEIDKDKATGFINDIYKISNITITSDEKDKKVNNVINSKLSGSAIIKSIVESEEFKNLGLTDEEYVKTIGKICLDEDLSSDEVNKYAEQLISGTNRNELLKTFINNNKFVTKCNKFGLEKGEYTASKIVSTSKLAEEYVKNAYEELINKNSDNLGNIKQEVASGKTTVTKMLQTFIESNAFKNRNLSNEDYVNSLFKASLNREPSSEEKEKYTKELETASKEDIFKEIVDTNEFKKLCNKNYLVADKVVEVIQDSEKQQTETHGKLQIKRSEKTTKDGKKIVYLDDVVFDLSKKTKGDVNGDGKVSVEDASYVLTKTVALMLNDVELSQDELEYVDINGDKMITAEDAKLILVYYAKTAAGLKPTWEDVINNSNTSDK